MSRPREFETDDILDRAGEVFWKFGYQATSIPELEAATGVGRGSLYNTFGGKEELYLAALARYQKNYGALPISHLEEQNVGNGIRKMFEAIIERMGRSDVPSGCFNTNSCLENDGRSERIGAVVASNLERIESRLQDVIERAVRTKQIPSDTNTKQLARFYAAVAQSLGVTSRASNDLTRLHDIVEVAMHAWPATQPTGSDQTRSGNRRRSNT